MTVTAPYSFADLVGDGVTTVYPIAFPGFFDGATVVAKSKVTGLILSGHVSGSNYVLDAPVPLGSGFRLLRVTPISQPRAFGNVPSITPARIEAALDRLTNIAQEVQPALLDAVTQAQFAALQATLTAGLATALRVPDAAAVLPAAPDRAGKFLSFSPSGDPLMIPPPSAPGPTAGAVAYARRRYLAAYFPNPSVIPADVTTYLRQAIADLPVGGTVELPPGLLTLTDQVLITTDNVKLKGQGEGVTVIGLQGGAAANAVKWSGPGVTATYTLATAFTAKAQSLYLTSVAGWAIGDICMIQATTPLGGLFLVMGRVSYVGAGYIALDRDIPFGSAAQSSVAVYKVALLTGGGMSDLTLDGSLATSPDATGRYTSYTSQQVFENIEYINWSGSGNSGAAYDTYGFENEWRGMHRLYKCGSISHSDFFLYGQEAPQIDKVHSKMSTGFGPQLAWCTHAQVGSIRTERAASRGCKFQGVLSSIIDKIHSTYHGTTAAGFSYGSAYNLIDQTYITHNGEVVGNESSLWFSDQGSHHNLFSMVEVYSQGEYAISFGNSDFANRIKHAAYTGNITLGTQTGGNANVIDATSGAF